MNILNQRAIAEGHTKTRGPWLALDHAWFRRNQPILLWMLNAPVLATIMRGLLRMDLARDVWMPRRTRIVEIGPSWYKVRLPDGQYRLDARTHPKYAKRLYYSFSTWWWTLHAIDSALLDRWAPSLSFGFLTLTAYPDPNAETTTVDGDVYRNPAEESWATIIAGAGNGFGDSDASIYATYMAAGDSLNLWVVNRRSITLFDTSALGADATISAAVLSVQGSSKQDGNVAAPTGDVYTSTPASNTALANSDYSQLGSISQTGAPITYANWSTVAYNDFTFDATGRGNVSKTGISKFGMRNANYDVAAAAPPWVTGNLSALLGAAADTAGTTSDPKLVVTYTVPATFRPHVIVMG